MSWSLLDIQNQIANEMDQSPTAPTEGGTDWNIRLNAINRANLDWSEVDDWNCLHKVHDGLISSAGNASYALPIDFRRLDGFPGIMWDGSSFGEFPAVDPSNNKLYNEEDNYVNIFDNAIDGKVMYIHSQTLASGASVQFTYWANPASLASASQLIECPDPTYLVQRSLYYLYKGREDARFPEAKVESEKILARMLQNENAKGIAFEERRIPNWNEQRYGFRIGRDG